MQQHAKTEPVKQLVLSHREHVCHLDLLSGLLLERVLNSLELSLDLDGIQGLGPEGSNDTTGLLGLVLHDEPPGGLGQHVDEGNDDGREDDSDGNWRAPSDGTGLELEEAEVDPRLERVTHTDEEAINDDVATAVAGAGGLTLPDGDDGTELTDAEADEDAADDELCEVEGGRLKDDTDERDDAGKEDDVPAAELIASPRTRQGAEQGTNDKGGDDEALEGRVLALLAPREVDGVDLREGLCPVLHGDQASQTGLVVSEADK